MSKGRHLSALFSVGTSTGLSDDELLERFLGRRDQADRAVSAAEAAFEAIVRRHGPMVLGVCRRYLDDPNDVEDAFQATFVVLFRRAGAIRIGESLAPWLHGVSRRIAARARAVAVRRKGRESGYRVEPATDPAAEDRRRETREALDEELDRLPTRYRIPIILCHLEGLTYQEAASRLDCPVGTIGTRLARGRELLKTRLNRRGAILPAGLWTVGPTTSEPAGVPPALVDATIKAVMRGIGGRAVSAGLVSASVVSLSEGLLRSMLMTRVKTAALALLTAGLIVTGGGLLLRSAAARQGEGRALPSGNVGTRGAEAPAAKRSPRATDPAQRARELIYFFRSYRVFRRDEQWAQTIRELATIGKDAVPELVAELDRTDGDSTLRSLGFTLRAIGDPRAVPALIRAIPKALRPPGSDCAVGIADPDLRAFMLSHQARKDDLTEFVGCSRPVSEILTALERITKHSEPLDAAGNGIRHIFLGGTPEQQAQQRASFEHCRKRWEAWWSEHWREFATEEELRSVELPKRDQDLVALTGAARYGVLFPTGPQVRLGPVRMLRLATSEYANGISHLDLDTGRVFRMYEGIKPADSGKPVELGLRGVVWNRQNGIDIRQQGWVLGIDLRLWLVDDSRWDTLEAEVSKDGPLPLGREVNISFALNTHVLETYLFTTREGGRGILQVFPKDPDADRIRLRYRMWLTAQPEPDAAPPVARPTAEPGRARSPGTPFGRMITAALEAQAEGRECFLDLETGRKSMPPRFLKPGEMAETLSHARDERFTRWCRDQGIDVVTHVAAASRRAVAKAKRGELEAPATIEQGSGAPSALFGFDMIAERIMPETFDELTVEEAREILGRTPKEPTRPAWMSIGPGLKERPDTFVFQTREGAVGVLQIEAAGKEPGSLTIRYRLERRD
jgi:RNA polymerase sigma factor (sigma-70 family)